MRNFNEASINSIESAGMLDGPGIRTVVFFNACSLRCLYCHNPETWCLGPNNTTTEKLFQRIKRNKSYFKNGGGVTFSGGEPLLHTEFIINLSKMLKEENIHIALDTAGINHTNDEIFKYIDLVILDIKHITKEGYKQLAGVDKFDESLSFIKKLNEFNKKIWIRQVIVPGYTDSLEYIKGLKKFVNKINNIEKIEFIPYHKYGESKYEKLNIEYPLKGLQDMSHTKCNTLFEEFNKIC